MLSTQAYSLRSWAPLVIAMLAMPTGRARAQDDFSFEIMEAEVADADKQRMEEAKRLLAEESYVQALGILEEILQNPKLQAYHAEAGYVFAKAFFRMGAYHSSLVRFGQILEVGPEHPHFKEAREWLFFIARRMQDRSRALGVLAQYARVEDLPAEFADELNYQLARFHFLNALELGAKGVDVEQSDVEESQDASGGFDFGNLDDSSDEDPFSKPMREGGSSKERESSGEGWDFGGGDDDGFGFEFGDANIDDGAKSKSKSKKKKKKKKKRAKVKNASKAHKSENPQNAEEAIRRALGHIAAVGTGFEQRPRALYLKGLSHFALGEFEPSVAAFREVVRLTDPKREGSLLDPKLREMAFFSLARIHYQFEQFRYAIFYYERIDRDSEAWLDALFESSWAYFRLGEYQRALGNLVTIQSPFFESEYYPESHILKAITFYENCRYPEARSFLAEFEAQYAGVIDELKRLAASGKGESSLYEELANLDQRVNSGNDDEQRSSEMTARLLRLAFRDKRLASYRSAIAEVDAERQLLQAMTPPFGGAVSHEMLLSDLAERRTSLVDAASGLLGAKLTDELASLQDLNAKLVRIQFEITKQEKEALAASLKSQSLTVPLVGYEFSAATDDERVYWPFLGEYWRDELGTYMYTLTHGCRPPEEG
ncbi:MAG: hypothetical protein ACO3JL_01145 [Myxococcota bacterium]